MEKKIGRAGVFKHNEKIYSLMNLVEQNKKLTKVELKIVEARCDGDSFGDLSKDDQTIFVTELMATGVALVGCQTPSTEYLIGKLRFEITNYILEFGYEALTEAEILLAFRLNAHGGLKHPSGLEIEQVEFVGCTFHVEYLAKVLSNYAALRNHLNRKFENQLNGY